MAKEEQSKAQRVETARLLAFTVNAIFWVSLSYGAYSLWEPGGFGVILGSCGLGGAMIGAWAIEKFIK